MTAEGRSSTTHRAREKPLRHRPSYGSCDRQDRVHEGTRRPRGDRDVDDHHRTEAEPRDRDRRGGDRPRCLFERRHADARCTDRSAHCGSDRSTLGGTFRRGVLGPVGRRVTGRRRRRGLALAAASGAVGPYLTSADGKALYVYAKDTTPGKSACNGQCATNWPPLTVPAGAAATAATGVSGTIGTVTRDDGTTQVTYNGKPVYYFSGDKSAGQTNGQGIGGVWSVATP